MYPSGYNQGPDPWDPHGRSIGEVVSDEPSWDTDEPTETLDISGVTTDIGDSPKRRRSNADAALAMLTVFVLVLGIGIIAHRSLTGNWTLPGVKDSPPISSAVPMPSTMASPPEPSKQAMPEQSVAPTGPIDQDVPTWIVVRRGEKVLVNSRIEGAYTPNGSTVDPPGDNPYWLSVSSKVGDSMTIPAVIVGHTMNGNWSMPFTILSEVKADDTIDITVPTGIVTFRADAPQGPEKGMMGFGPEPDTIKLVTCAPLGNQNIVISGKRISSKRTV